MTAKIPGKLSSGSLLERGDLKNTLGGIVVFFVLSCIMLCCSWPGQWVLALLWALAFDAVGALLGFLFGIPKILQPLDAFDSPGLSSFKDQAFLQNRYRISINTNLEQISDWLTKIIVGVGLVEFRSLKSLITSISRYVGESFTPAVGNNQHAAAMFVLFTTWGFLSSFILTRMYFTSAFAQADLGAIVVSSNDLASSSFSDTPSKKNVQQ